MSGTRVGRIGVGGGLLGALLCVGILAGPVFSWDGGATWTTIKTLAVSATAETTYNFGAAADTWGRAWTPGQFSTSNLRLIDASSSSTKRFDLDFVALRVTYRP